MLWETLGPALAAVVATFAIVTPLTVWIVKAKPFKRSKVAKKDERLLTEEVTDRKYARRYLDYAVEQGDEMAMQAALALLPEKKGSRLANRPRTFQDRIAEKFLEDRMEGDYMERMLKYKMQQKMLKELDEDEGGLGGLLKPLLQGAGQIGAAAFMPKLQQMGQQVIEQPPRPALPPPPPDEEPGPNVVPFRGPVDQARHVMMANAAGAMLQALNQLNPPSFANWLVNQPGFTQLTGTIVTTPDEQLPAILGGWANQSPEFSEVVAWLESHPQQTGDIIAHVRAMRGAPNPSTNPANTEIVDTSEVIDQPPSDVASAW